MAISEFEIFKIKKAAKKFCNARNDKYPSDQFYIDYRLEDQTLYFFEIRSHWNDPEKQIEIMAAKCRYIKKDSLWKLYWQRQNMRWQLYEPNGTNKELDSLLKEVWEDSLACFWG